jgi:hypothetical protein
LLDLTAFVDISKQKPLKTPLDLNPDVVDITHLTTKTKKDGAFDLVTGQQTRPTKKPKIQSDSKRSDNNEVTEESHNSDKCPVCQETPKDPWSSRCGHLWCVITSALLTL